MFRNTRFRYTILKTDRILFYLAIALLFDASSHSLTLEQNIRPHRSKTSYSLWPVRFVILDVLFWIVENILGNYHKVSHLRAISNVSPHDSLSRSLNGALSKCQQYDISFDLTP